MKSHRHTCLPDKPTRHILLAIWNLTSSRHRRNLVICFVLTLIAAAAEFSLLWSAKEFLSKISSQQPTPIRNEVLQLIVTLAVSNLARLSTLRMQSRTAIEIGSEFSQRLFESAVYSSYETYIRREGAQLFSLLETSRQIAVTILIPITNALSSVVIGVSIIFAIAVSAPILIGPIVLLIVASYWLFSHRLKSGLRIGSSKIAQVNRAGMRLVHDAQMGFREIHLSHLQGRVAADFAANEATRKAIALQNSWVETAPRFIIESAIGIVMVALIPVWLAHSDNTEALIPTIGLAALGIRQLMPLVNSCFQCWSKYQSSYDSLTDLLTKVAQIQPQAPVPLFVPNSFSRDITLHDVWLDRGEHKGALRGINLTIRHGERIAIIGPSGSGKSSLLDVILGLIPPTGGQVYIDGEPLVGSERIIAWQTAIAAVGQAPYLCDQTIGELISNGSDADCVRLQKVAEQALLAEWIGSLSKGFDTRVGDRGILISGGQRQRMALAQALYSDAKVLILDEATGQLDETTEKQVLDALAALSRDKTIIIVTHRTGALAMCNHVVELRDGQIVTDRVWK